METDILEDVAQIAQLLAAGRRGLRQEIEDLAVFESVVCKSRHTAILVEINRDHALIDDFVRQEGGRALRLLRNVVEGLPVHGGHGRRRAKDDEHLFLRCPDGNLFQGTFGEHVASLQGFRHAAAGSKAGSAKKRGGKSEGLHPAKHDYNLRHPISILQGMGRSRYAGQPPKPRQDPMIFPLRRGARQSTISSLYGTIVAQARLPTFYREYGVPDTVDGRFELLVMHLALILNRLGDDPAGRGFGQTLFDHFCSDMDHNLREIGVGDLSVPKHMQRIGEAFYGRARAYQAGLDALDRAVLVDAVARNIYRSEGGDRSPPARLAAYMREAAAAIAAQALSELLAGRVILLDPAVSVPLKDQISMPES